VDKNASQQKINSLVLKTSPKDNPEIGKALMAIQNYKHNYDNTVEYTPDGHRVRVLIPLDLDPEDCNLWSPYEKDSGLSW
ncbi:12520_t:CDS:2, partial [Racocetra persica]